MRRLLTALALLVTACATRAPVIDPPAAVAPAAKPSSAGWLWLTAFQSGKLEAIDLGTESIVRTFAVDDGAGSTGFALTPDGATLYLADGASPGRLRVFDVASQTLAGEASLKGRALLLGHAPLFHLERDSLFVGTLDPSTAQAGTLSLGTKALTAQAPPSWPCASPLLARGTATVALCAGAIHRLGGASTTTPIAALEDVAEALATPDRIVAIGRFRAKRWWLLDWRAGEPSPRALDLHAVDGVDDATGRNGMASVDVSPDGKTLAVVHGKTAWFIDAESHAILRIVRFDRPVDHARFTLDGSALLTLESHVGDVPATETALLRIDVTSGAIRRVLAGKVPQHGPILLSVAKAAKG